MPYKKLTLYIVKVKVKDWVHQSLALAESVRKFCQTKNEVTLMNNLVNW
jgi:hypothetical protein